MSVHLIKCTVIFWVLSSLALPQVGAIKLVRSDADANTKLDMSKLKCAVPSLSSNFQKACTIEEEQVELKPLKPLELSPAKFSTTGERITRNVYCMGLPPEVQRPLVDYFDQVGIMERF